MAADVSIITTSNPVLDWTGVPVEVTAIVADDDEPDNADEAPVDCLVVLLVLLALDYDIVVLDYQTTHMQAGSQSGSQLVALTVVFLAFLALLAFFFAILFFSLSFLFDLFQYRFGFVLTCLL